MSSRDDWEIQNAVEIMREKEKREVYDNVVAEGLTSLVAPIVIPLIFGVYILLAVFGIPFVLLLWANAALAERLSQVSSLVLGVVLSLLVCGLDLFLLIKDFRQEKQGWKVWAKRIYLMLFLLIPWLALLIAQYLTFVEPS